MIELGLPMRGHQHANCMNAVHTFFSPFWGKVSEDKFSEIPKSIKNFKAKLIRKNKFMGGLYDLVFDASWKSFNEEEWKINYRYKRSSNSKFTTRSNQPLAKKICLQLNEEHQLKSRLDKLDLVELKISSKSQHLQLQMTPMGGGICFLMVPPIRYTIPLPEAQAEDMAWSIEKMSNILDKSSEFAKN